MSNQDPRKESEYDLTGIPPLDEEFSLEEILAEYGGSLEQTLMRQAEAEIRAREETESPSEPDPGPDPAAQAKDPAKADPKPAARPETSAETDLQAKGPAETEPQSTDRPQAKDPAKAEPKPEPPADTDPQPDAQVEARARVEANAWAEAKAQAEARIRADAEARAAGKARAEAETRTGGRTSGAEADPAASPEARTDPAGPEDPKDPESLNVPDPEADPEPAENPDHPIDPEDPASSPALKDPLPERTEIPPAIPGVPEPPQPISLEEVVGSTVSAVMEEASESARAEDRRALFSRRPLEETAPKKPPVRREPKPRIEPIGPERDLWDAAEDCRSAWRNRKGSVLPALLTALLAAAPLLAERYGLTIPMWTGDPRFQSILYLAALGIQMVLCRHVFLRGFSMLARGRCVGELLTALAGLAAAGDCALCLILTGRTPVTPYAAAVCASLFFAQWGAARESRGMYDTFRAAAMDDPPPYLITDTARGACKQRGTVPGFYTTALRPDGSALLQTVLLPLVLVGAFVFAGMTSLGRGRGSDFLLNWSILLAAGGTCALPLCWALPWSRLARHLQQVGCAVAGWAGAERISRRRAMILTDTDLFPPGTVRLNGVKIYGGERMKALSYAEAMARRAGSGLERLFDRLLRGEGGVPSEEPKDFSFYEEGGWSARIRAETVMMGTASFMKKMEVRIPGDITMKTGIFMAVDRRLTAVFVIKYNPADNVDFALQLLRRGRITPILASRDPNIDPVLLKRKFHKGLRLEYPRLTDRVSLSEAGQDRDLPRALLFREGLLPYAETVAGSRRLCQAVRQSTLISLAGSAAGVLLGFYLLNRQAYDLLNPLSLLVFLLLWTLPVLLITDWAARY